jgi:hypothetical protein
MRSIDEPKYIKFSHTNEWGEIKPTWSLSFLLSYQPIIYQNASIISCILTQNI